MNILLLEDHPIFRFGVRHTLLQRWPEAQVMEAGTLAEALALLRTSRGDQPPNQRPTVAVVDLNLPDADGLEGVTQLLRAAPELRVLVLSLNREAAYATRLLQMGASGYLNKDRAAEELVLAVERVSKGGRYITAELAERLAALVTGTASDRPPHEQLSQQEHRVMQMLASGRRINEIAQAMHLSPKTVSTYRTRVLDKLGLQSNVEVARYCMQHGLSEGAADAGPDPQHRA